MENIDILIIGAGPGGYEMAAEAARKGLRTVLVERDKLGGTCLNRGCIPTKAMAHAADVLREAREGARFGIGVPEVVVDFPKLVAHREEVIGQLREGIAGLMAAPKNPVEVIYGEARFVAPKEIEVDGRRLTADKIVIATGSAPAALPIPGADTAITSDRLLALEEIPASMVIIGGGVIGLEFASIFSTLGSEVTVVEYCKEVLPPFDKDIAKRLRTQLAASGIRFVVGAAVTAIDGRTVTYESKGKTETVEADTVVMAVGRRPVVPAGAAEAGIELTPRGAVKVDPQTYETSVPGVYAIGDVNAICMLAHAATAQGMRVLGEEVDTDVVPSVVFTSPELAMVGRSEQTLKDAGVDFKTAKSLFRANGKALTMGETSGMVKILFDPATRLILGAFIMGPHAADMIEELALAMTSGLTLDRIAATIHPHPTLCEAILAAARQA